MRSKAALPCEVFCRDRLLARPNVVSDARAEAVRHGADGWDDQRLPNEERPVTDRKLPGVSFSWRRAVGLSAFKGKVSRAIGVPLTESGRERKLGRSFGRAVIVAFLLGVATGAAAVFWLTR